MIHLLKLMSKNPKYSDQNIVVQIVKIQNPQKKLINFNLREFSQIKYQNNNTKLFLKTLYLGIS